MGDFNLDIEMEHRTDYVYKTPLSHLTNFATENNLAQLVHFKTWSRTINGVRKESTLDHIYTDNAILVAEVTSKVPTFGDHDLIIAKLKIKTLNSIATTWKRNWRNYSQSSLLNNLKLNDMNFYTDAQSQ